MSTNERLGYEEAITTWKCKKCNAPGSGGPYFPNGTVPPQNVPLSSDDNGSHDWGLSFTQCICSNCGVTVNEPTTPAPQLQALPPTAGCKSAQDGNHNWTVGGSFYQYQS